MPRYDFNWQTYYMFKEPVQVPKGAKIVSTAWYDNSAANKNNPDPKVDVHVGRSDLGGNAVHRDTVKPELRGWSDSSRTSRCETQMSTIEQRFAQEKVLAQAYALFGGIAVFVAAIGLFGLMSYNVSRRTREIGIRMAMGAQRREVLGLDRCASRWCSCIAGIVIGIGISIASGEYVASQLFGLAPTDVTTLLAAMAVMVAVSAAAGYLPARRAARVDPMVALRYE